MAEIYRVCIEGADWMSATAQAAADFHRDSAGERQFVVEMENEVVGFISVWEPDAFIHLLFVHPRYQGCGVGTRLLEGLIQHVSPPWRLKCVCANRGAREFYEKRGWRWLEQGLSEGGAYHLLEFNCAG